MFNESNCEVGNTEQNLIIRTRGKIKIQIGNKFIDFSIEDILKRLEQLETKN